MSRHRARIPAGTAVSKIWSRPSSAGCAQEATTQRQLIISVLPLFFVRMTTTATTTLGDDDDSLVIRSRRRGRPPAPHAPHQIKCGDPAPLCSAWPDARLLQENSLFPLAEPGLGNESGESSPHSRTFLIHFRSLLTSRALARDLAKRRPRPP
jgi:hypothetical protein